VDQPNVPATAHTDQAPVATASSEVNGYPNGNGNAINNAATDTNSGSGVSNDFLNRTNNSNGHGNNAASGVSNGNFNGNGNSNVNVNGNGAMASSEYANGMVLPNGMALGQPIAPVGQTARIGA
jgi:hypothetical protein